MNFEHDPEKHALGLRPDGWTPVFPRDKREAFAPRSCSSNKLDPRWRYRGLGVFGDPGPQWLWCGPLARLHTKLVGHQMPWTGGLLAIRHGRIGALFDLGDQFILDAEHHIGIEIFVAADEDMRDQRLVTRCVDEEMHVRWAVRVTP